MGPEDIIPIYRRHAGAFDRLRTHALFERPWLERFVAALPGNDVLDLGCGMGEPLAAWLLGQGCRITGVDTSDGLLALARARFPDHRWIEHDMRTLALPDRFAGILAWDSFFLLTPSDQRQMFEVFRCHAKPGAALMFTSGPSESQSWGEFEGEALYHASLSPEEYRSLLDLHGFDVMDHRANDPGCDYHTIWLARAR